MPWTDEMIERLKKMWEEGLSTGEIGKRLGVSKNSIVNAKKVARVLAANKNPSPASPIQLFAIVILLSINC